MATYSEVSITGYNSNPPEDDGSAVSSNEVSWSKHKTKIGDPLKTAIETTQTNISTLATSLTGEFNAPSGTAMLFMQTSAPTGWTKDTTGTLNNTALRLVTGTVTSRTDQTAFTTVFAKTSVDNFTLTQATMPAHAHASGSLSAASHNHSYDDPDTKGGNFPSTGGISVVRDSSSGTTGNSGALTVSGTTGNSGGGAAHAHGMDIRVNYHDVIKATKD